MNVSKGGRARKALWHYYLQNVQQKDKVRAPGNIFKWIHMINFKWKGILFVVFFLLSLADCSSAALQMQHCHKILLCPFVSSLRERERERQTERGRERERDRQTERGRERERDSERLYLEAALPCTV